MLVLGRKVNQRIMIDAPNGDRIIVAITDIGVDKVRVGIEAPAAYQIMREEITTQKGKADGLR